MAQALKAQRVEEKEAEDPQEIIPAMEGLGVIVREEIDIQIGTAKRFPRDLTRFKKRALDMATFDERTAEECIYTLPRAGKNITGPSVRLAEIVHSSWGNIRSGTRIVSLDDRYVKAQAICWDLENNVLVGFEVMRRITDRYGRRYSEDMIVTTANAASSIAFRDAVFKVVPRGIWKSIEDQCREVIAGTEETLSERLGAAVTYFGKMDVSEERVLGRLGRTGLESVTRDDLVVLKGLATALKEGSTSIDEAFPVGGIRESRDLNIEDQMKKAGATTDPAKKPQAPPTEGPEPGPAKDPQATASAPTGNGTGKAKLMSEILKHSKALGALGVEAKVIIQDLTAMDRGELEALERDLSGKLQAAKAK